MEDVIIGLEIHVSLNTKTKLFCSCALPTEQDLPNTKTCDVCVGFPGSKPVLNKKVVEDALKLALALKCAIAPELIFSRKVYFYPDMGKNYQITQYEIPLGASGKLNIGEKDIEITRIHIEEDPASLIHQGNTVLVDYNRSGKPLCEIVTEPQFTSPEEAREFLRRLISILKYLQIFDEKEGIIKADGNVSIKGFERTEIKNITGFREIERALTYEIERQKQLIKDGNGIIKRETRGWDAAKGMTVFQRSKEEEQDYGYIIDSDLVPVDITDEMITKTRESLPELPELKTKRYQEELKLQKTDADVIANDYSLSKIFEEAIKNIDAGFAAEWIRREVARVLNYNKKELEETFIEKHLLEVMTLIGEKKITRRTGQKLMERLVEEDLNVPQYVKEQGLEIVEDEGFLEEAVKKVVEENKEAVEDYKQGKEKAYQFLFGQIMKATKGRAEPQSIHESLKKVLS